MSKGEEKHLPTLTLTCNLRLESTFPVWKWKSPFQLQGCAPPQLQETCTSLPQQEKQCQFPQQLESCPRHSHPGKNSTGCTWNRLHSSIFYCTWAALPFFEAELVMAICFSNILWHHKLPVTASFKAWLMGRLYPDHRERKDTASWVASLGHINILYLMYQEYIYAVTKGFRVWTPVQALSSAGGLGYYSHPTTMKGWYRTVWASVSESRWLWTQRNLVVPTPEASVAATHCHAALRWQKPNRLKLPLFWTVFFLNITFMLSKVSDKHYWKSISCY